MRWHGADPSGYPANAVLRGVTVRLPMVCWELAAWPAFWPPYRNVAGRANCNVHVIARIDGVWHGAPWEALDAPRYNGKTACRKLEALTNQTGEGPFGQAEGPFVHWRPAKGERFWMMLSTWTRHGEVPIGERGRSNLVEVIW